MAMLSIVSDNTGMILYESMCKAIVECHRVDEIKTIRDKAIALEKYSQQAKNKENERLAKEIRLRAERKCGELLAKLPKAPTRSRYLSGLRPVAGLNPEPKRTVIERNTIGRRQAQDWERIAKIPINEFEAEVKKPKATTKSLNDYARNREPPPSVKSKPKPKWHDPHLDAQIKLVEGLRRISDGLKLAAFGMRIKDAVLDVMSKQETDLPATVNNELRKIKKQVEILQPLWVPLCPCPFKNQKPVTMPVLITHEKDTINA
jgi:hypothetical protein